MEKWEGGLWGLGTHLIKTEKIQEYDAKTVRSSVKGKHVKFSLNPRNLKKNDHRIFDLYYLDFKRNVIGDLPLYSNRQFFSSWL